MAVARYRRGDSITEVVIGREGVWVLVYKFYSYIWKRYFMPTILRGCLDLCNGLYWAGSWVMLGGKLHQDLLSNHC